MYQPLTEKKQSYFENNDTLKISENKMFWKTVKPMISNKCVNRDSITLVKDGKFFLENLEITEIFNVTFLNLVKEMDKSMFTS